MTEQTSTVTRKKGRPTKRSTGVKKTLLAALKGGNTRATACKIAGIHYATLKRWCALSAPFCAEVDRAEAEAEQKHVANIRIAGGKGNWQASAWWLERRRTGDWRKPSERVEIADYRREAAALAAELGKPELAEQIAAEMQADRLLSQEASR